MHLLQNLFKKKAIKINCSNMCLNMTTSYVNEINVHGGLVDTCMLFDRNFLASKFCYLILLRH